MVERYGADARNAEVIAPAQDPRTNSRRPNLSSRLRTARTTQALSLRELAGRIGVSASLISQIETGKVQPSVNTLYALASELGLSIDSLLFDERTHSHDRPSGLDRGGAGRPSLPAVQRSHDHKAIQLSSGVRWERLTEAAEPGRDFLCLVYEPGGESTPPDARHRHSGREWGYVVSGTLHIEVGAERYVLGPGDSITYESTEPHRLHNPGPEEARGIWFVLGRGGKSAPSS